MRDERLADLAEPAPTSALTSPSMISRATTATAARKKSPSSPPSAWATTSSIVKLWPSAIVVLFLSSDSWQSRRA
jgi:hypothetical protein